jgi:hypothetical protein
VLEDDMDSECGVNEDKKNACRILVVKRKGKRPVVRSERRCVDIIAWYGLDSFGLGSGPVEGSCEHGNELSASIKCFKVL